jgi:hypothetical protein
VTSVGTGSGISTMTRETYSSGSVRTRSHSGQYASPTRTVLSGSGGGRVVPSWPELRPGPDEESLAASESPPASSFSSSCSDSSFYGCCPAPPCLLEGVWALSYFLRRFSSSSIRSFWAAFCWRRNAFSARSRWGRIVRPTERIAEVERPGNPSGPESTISGCSSCSSLRATISTWLFR